MGYYTSYTLEIKQGDDYTTDHAAQIAENTGYTSLFDDTVKWYDHEKDMLAYSKRYPKVVFELHGDGEENGDLWYKWFKNGQMQEAKARIVYDEYDPDFFDAPEPAVTKFIYPIKPGTRLVKKGQEVTEPHKGYVEVFAYTLEAAQAAITERFKDQYPVAWPESEFATMQDEYPTGALLELDATVEITL